MGETETEYRKKGWGKKARGKIFDNELEKESCGKGYIIENILNENSNENQVLGSRKMGFLFVERGYGSRTCKE